jgi:hypothetical protein
MTRYLRIAAAVTFALLAVALIGLWVRSHYYAERIRGPVAEKNGLHLWSSGGELSMVLATYAIPGELPEWSCDAFPFPRVSYNRYPPRFVGILARLGFYFHGGRQIMLSLPYWFLTVVSASLAALFAFKRTWRFTIRTLLIATTLIALALGLGVYLL